MHDKNYPQEYIDGHVKFFGRDFIVTPDVLIPRLETEWLVRRARQFLSASVMSSEAIAESRHLAWKKEQDFSITKITGTDFLHSKWQRKTIIIDIGCGSGIIGTCVADLADEVIFLDISPEALRVTEQNFRTHFPDKRAQFIISDLLSNLPSLLGEGLGVRCLFVTNLPYIKDEDWQNMSADTVHEPKLALFGGEETGFELYEKLFQELNSVKLWNCKSVKLLYEFWFDQREVAEEIVKKYPQWKYSFFADYAGIERFGEIVL